MASELTTAGKLLSMAGLTFHSGRRLADHPELILAIEAEARSLVIAEVRERVERLPRWYLGPGYPLDQMYQTPADDEAAPWLARKTVLAAIDTAEGKS